MYIVLIFIIHNNGTVKLRTDTIRDAEIKPFIDSESLLTRYFHSNFDALACSNAVEKSLARRFKQR